MKGKKVLALIVSIAAVLTSVISPAMAVAASYGAPDGWRNLPDYYVRIEEDGPEAAADW
jgi:hypothetical protein